MLVAAEVDGQDRNHLVLVSVLLSLVGIVVLVVDSTGSRYLVVVGFGPANFLGLPSFPSENCDACDGRN